MKTGIRRRLSCPRTTHDCTGDHDGAVTINEESYARLCDGEEGRRHSQSKRRRCVGHAWSNDAESQGHEADAWWYPRSSRSSGAWSRQAQSHDWWSWWPSAAARRSRHSCRQANATSRHVRLRGSGRRWYAGTAGGNRSRQVADHETSSGKRSSAQASWCCTWWRGGGSRQSESGRTRSAGSATRTNYCATDWWQAGTAGP